MEIQGIRQIRMTVRDLKEALAFYRDALGFFENWVDDVLGQASLLAGDTEIFLEQGPPEPGSLRVIFRVEEIEAYWKIAQERGWRALNADGEEISAILQLPNQEKAFYLRDPDGYLVGFLEKVPTFP